MSLKNKSMAGPLTPMSAALFMRWKRWKGAAGGKKEKNGRKGVDSVRSSSQIRGKCQIANFKSL